MTPTDPRPGRHQREVHPPPRQALLIRAARALRAVHQELEIASECLLRPGLRRTPTRWPGSGPAPATAWPAGTCPARLARRANGLAGKDRTRCAGQPLRRRLALR